MIRKIAFLGTPEISTTVLRYIATSGYEIPLVVTGEDKRRGRGSDLTPSPVKLAALELGLEVSHDPKVLLETDFDLAVVVAYGRLISEPLLAKGTFVNLHFSLLPRWRGAAPMERAILAGDTETGVCLMRLVKELDAGPLYQVRRVPLDNEICLDDLAAQLGKLANEALGAELALGDSAFSASIEQVGPPTYAHKLSVEDLRIDWSCRGVEVLRQVRLGRAWTVLDGARFKILSARVSSAEMGLAAGELSGVHVGTQDGVIELGRVQPQNKRIMAAGEWVRGLKHANELRFV